MTDKNFTYHAIARAIADHGVETMFGLMGDANLFMVDHFVRGCGGTFVPAAFEGNSILMAFAYGHVARTVGVATVTHGPGLTNCATALTEGARGHIPMVLLAGDTPVMQPHHLQSIDQRELVKATGAGFEQMRSPETAAEDVAQAFFRARQEKRPIVLNMPADFMWKETEYQKVIFPVFDTPAMVPQGETLEEAIGIIASARRPIILAGAGAVEARENLIRLADRLEAPLATTLKAKGLFRGHPFDMDIFGTLSTPAAYDAIAKSDCVVAFGASLHYFTTDQGKLMKGKRVVQVDNEVTAIGKIFQPDQALVADAGLTADNIIEWLDEAEIQGSGFTGELDMEELTAHPVNVPSKTKDGHINYVHALERLETMLPEDRIVSSDGGRFMTEVWCRISVPDPHSFIATTNFGSIGLGLQEAIGASLAAEGRPVVLFTGDGGFMMNGINEFNTAVRLKRDLIVIICNDSAYGAEHIQFLDRQMDPALSQFDWPSFAEVATALGGQGISVRADADLDKARDVIDKRDRPVLIELILDPDDVPRMRN